jgi:hypothetical protein
MSGSLLLVDVWACPDRVRRVCRTLDWGCAQWALLTVRSGREEQRRSRFAACRPRSREGEVGCSSCSYAVSIMIM